MITDFRPQDYSQDELEIGRARVANGAAFFNKHLPGWQKRIIAAGSLLDMNTSDYCAAAISAWRSEGPDGELMFTHGDVGRAFRHLGFNSTYMGTMSDKDVCPEVLEYFWKQAALTVVPLPPALEQQSRQPKPVARKLVPVFLTFLAIIGAGLATIAILLV